MARGKRAPDALFRPLAKPRGGAEKGRSGSQALEAIWQVVCAIPRGRVSTYGDVARAAGLLGCARQAGYALRVAPRELNLPWHRVVGSGGRIVFPSGSRGHREQTRRLRAEGISVSAGRVPASVLTQLDEL